MCMNGFKSSSHFAPEVRLFTAIDEEYVVAMSLGGKPDSATVTSLPAGAILKLQFATNIKALRDTQELARLSDRALALSSHIRDRIVVHDVNLASRDLRLNGADNKQKAGFTYFGKYLINSCVATLLLYIWHP